MTPAEEQNQSIAPLLTGLLEGGLSPDELGQLQARLAGDAAARHAYINHLFVHAMLKWECAEPSTQFSFDGTLAGTDPTASEPPKSPLLGFLGSLGTQFYQRGMMFLVLFTLGLTLWSLTMRRQITPETVPQSASSQHSRNGSVASLAAAPVVANVVSAAHCQGRERGYVAPTAGDPIVAGESIELATGAMEIYFERGIRVVLQAPLQVEVVSASEMHLAAGKLTAEILKPSAVGFRVKTPDAVYVDLGTEFGVEVTPVGSSRIHVFRGEVEVSLASHGATIPRHTLHESDGALLGGKKVCMTFIKDTGESFLRTMADVDRDQHVIAYWRFEDHPAGELIPDALWNTANKRATVDSSYNGNDLYTYSMHTRPAFSEDVSIGVIPQTGLKNICCLDNTEPPQEGAPTRDVYTFSPFSHAAPVDIQEITPQEWTVEASVRPAELGRVQTFVGRDGAETHVNTPARLAFQITPEGHPCIRFKDMRERFHVVTATDFTVELNCWVHLAAVSDGKKLSLYANKLDGQGYRELASQKLPEDSLTALSNVDPDAIWSVGRGKSSNGWPGEWFKGWIDEVRISAIARAPDEFLFAPRRVELE